MKLGTLDRESFPDGEPGNDAWMFELAPVSLWLEDYSGVRNLFSDWGAAGVTDIRAYLAADPKRVKQCSDRIRVIKVTRGRPETGQAML